MSLKEQIASIIASNAFVDQKHAGDAQMQKAAALAKADAILALCAKSEENLFHAMKEIAGCETEYGNSTVRKMAKIAQDAITVRDKDKESSDYYYLNQKAMQILIDSGIHGPFSVKKLSEKGFFLILVHETGKVYQVDTKRMYYSIPPKSLAIQTFVSDPNFRYNAL